MAPEIILMPRNTPEAKARLRDKRLAQYDEKVDIWALGCVAFELLYGYNLFHADHTADIEKRIAVDEPLRLPTVSRAKQNITGPAMEFILVRSASCLSCAASVLAGEDDL